jgi:NAD-dependent DNA ligase
MIAGKKRMADLSLIKFYFAGNLSSMSTQVAKSKVIAKGGIIREEISNDLWYLVTNNPNLRDPELKKARDLGVLFIDEKDFLAMLK